MLVIAIELVIMAAALLLRAGQLLALVQGGAEGGVKALGLDSCGFGLQGSGFRLKV